MKRISLPVDINSTSQLMSFVESSVKAPQDVVSKLLIACDEVISNIINYSEAHEITLEIADEKELVLVFSDDGKAFDPLEQKTPDTETELKQRQIGGLGIFLVKSLMDEVSYKYSCNRNVLTLKKFYPEQ